MTGSKAPLPGRLEAPTSVWSVNSPRSPALAMQAAERRIPAQSNLNGVVFIRRVKQLGTRIGLKEADFGKEYLANNGKGIP